MRQFPRRRPRRLTHQQLQDRSGGDVRRAIRLAYPPLVSDHILEQIDAADDPAAAAERMRDLLGIHPQNEPPRETTARVQRTRRIQRVRVETLGELIRLICR